MSASAAEPNVARREVALARHLEARLPCARLFLCTALGAVIAGGLASALLAHAPTRGVMWLVAFLILVVGLAQAVLGFGQAWLPAAPPPLRWRRLEWVLFNLGSAAVIVGRLADVRTAVVVGSALFAASLLAFLFGVRGAGQGALLTIYRGVLIVTFVGACVGLVFTLGGILR